MDGQAAAWRRGALAALDAVRRLAARGVVQRCAAQRAERRLAEPHAVRRCVAQLAVQPSAVRHGALMRAERAPREEQAPYEGPREARELQGRRARPALLPVSPPVSAVARLRLSPAQQKR
jgi:hypothetical protein